MNLTKAVFQIILDLETTAIKKIEEKMSLLLVTHRKPLLSHIASG